MAPLVSAAEVGLQVGGEGETHYPFGLPGALRGAGAGSLRDEIGELIRRIDPNWIDFGSANVVISAPRPGGRAQIVRAMEQLVAWFLSARAQSAVVLQVQQLA